MRSEKIVVRSTLVYSVNYWARSEDGEKLIENRPQGDDWRLSIMKAYVISLAREENFPNDLQSLDITQLTRKVVSDFTSFLTQLRNKWIIIVAADVAVN